VTTLPAAPDQAALALPADVLNDVQRTAEAAASRADTAAAITGSRDLEVMRPIYQKARRQMRRSIRLQMWPKHQTAALSAADAIFKAWAVTLAELRDTHQGEAHL